MRVRLLERYCDGDLCVVEYTTLSNLCEKLIFVSYYADINSKEIVHPKLRLLLRKCRRDNIPVLLHGDFNAHSQMWYSETDNARGKVFEADLIQEFNLNVLNTPGMPTFYSAAHESETNIDVTMCTSDIYKFVKNHVHRDPVPAAGHVGLEYTLF